MQSKSRKRRSPKHKTLPPTSAEPPVRLPSSIIPTAPQEKSPVTCTALTTQSTVSVDDDDNRDHDHDIGLAPQDGSHEETNPGVESDAPSSSRSSSTFLEEGIVSDVPHSLSHLDASLPWSPPSGSTRARLFDAGDLVDDEFDGWEARDNPNRDAIVVVRNLFLSRSFVL